MRGNQSVRVRLPILRRFLGASEDGISGVAAIEFAAVGASLVLLTVCVVDVGMGFYRKMQVQNAAQAGAQYAVAKGFSISSISSAVTAATNFSGIAASPAPNQYCGCASNSGITPISCSAICPDGSAPGGYVEVSAQAIYNTILNYPLIPSSFTFNAKSTVRTQ